MDKTLEKNTEKTLEKNTEKTLEENTENIIFLPWYLVFGVLYSRNILYPILYHLDRNALKTARLVCHRLCRLATEILANIPEPEITLNENEKILFRKSIKVSMNDKIEVMLKRLKSELRLNELTVLQCRHPVDGSMKWEEYMKRHTKLELERIDIQSKVSTKIAVGAACGIWDKKFFNEQEDKWVLKDEYLYLRYNKWIYADVTTGLYMTDASTKKRYILTVDSFSTQDTDYLFIFTPTENWPENPWSFIFVDRQYVIEMSSKDIQGQLSLVDNMPYCEIEVPETWNNDKIQPFPRNEQLPSKSPLLVPGDNVLILSSKGSKVTWITPTTSAVVSYLAPNQSTKNKIGIKASPLKTSLGAPIFRVDPKGGEISFVSIITYNSFNVLLHGHNGVYPAGHKKVHPGKYYKKIVQVASKSFFKKKLGHFLEIFLYDSTLQKQPLMDKDDW